MKIEREKTHLRQHSVRSLAWIGDAAFEYEVRLRIAQRGDWPTDLLDKTRAAVVRAESQAALLTQIEARLEERELNVVQRAKNAQVRGSGRSQRDVKAYRSATGLEALVAYWALGGEVAWKRFGELLADPIESAIDRALEQLRPRFAKRG